MKTGQWINRWGAAKAVDLTDQALDHRLALRQASPEIPGFIDATSLLGPGIFILLREGRVVYIGRASSPMLPKLAAIRSDSRPKWLPKIRFDEVLIRRVHPDALDSVYTQLLAEFQPEGNLDVAPALRDPIERRI
jgi:hypothetical protein